MLLFPRDLEAGSVLRHAHCSTLSKRLVFIISLDYFPSSAGREKGRGLGTLPSHRGSERRSELRSWCSSCLVNIAFLLTGNPWCEHALSEAVHTAEHGTLGTWLPGEYDAAGEDEGHLQAEDTLEREGETVRCAHGAQETDPSMGQ